ncbi:MAG: hypothetical protein MUF42_13635 [Cytophagaceae bacterium]|jgi:hypothetical protein|nr:hypothetical protein [Cytophagaceae bacterium]
MPHAFKRRTLAIVLASLGWFAIQACQSSDNTAKANPYAKQVGTSFVVDSIEYSVKEFYYSEEKGKTELSVLASMRNLSRSEKRQIPSQYTLLSNHNNPLRYEPYQLTPTLLIDSNTLYLKYTLPPREGNYFNYNLQFLHPTDTSQRAEVMLYKSFRSEG